MISAKRLGTHGREHTGFARLNEMHDDVTAVLPGGIGGGYLPANHRKRLAEEEQLELEEFQDACMLPQSEGVAYAMEKLGSVQANVKEQFKEVFLELKQSIEVCFPSSSSRRGLVDGVAD